MPLEFPDGRDHCSPEPLELQALAMCEECRSPETFQHHNHTDGCLRQRANIECVLVCVWGTSLNG